MLFIGNPETVSVKHFSINQQEMVFEAIIELLA